MDELRCAVSSCNRELTTDMQIEYSNWLSDYFCSPNCATDYYFNYMESTPFDPDDRRDEMEERGIELIDRKLYRKR